MDWPSEHARADARIDNLTIAIQKEQRESHLAFWQVAATLVGGAAAFFAGGVAVVKLFSH